MKCSLWVLLLTISHFSLISNLDKPFPPHIPKQLISFYTKRKNVQDNLFDCSQRHSSCYQIYSFYSTKYQWDIYYGVSSTEADAVWFQMYICLRVQCSFSTPIPHLFCQKFTAIGSVLFASTKCKQNCRGLNTDSVVICSLVEGTLPGIWQKVFVVHENASFRQSAGQHGNAA